MFLEGRRYVEVGQNPTQRQQSNQDLAFFNFWIHWFSPKPPSPLASGLLAATRRRFCSSILYCQIEHRRNLISPPHCRGAARIPSPCNWCPKCAHSAKSLQSLLRARVLRQELPRSRPDLEASCPTNLLQGKQDLAKVTESTSTVGN